MLKSHNHKALVYTKGVALRRTWPTSKCYPLVQPQLYPSISSFSVKFCTTTSVPHSFTASYLINNCGFSPESAFKASRKLPFETSQKPDSVLTCFRNHGFSNSQIHDIVRRQLWLLSCDPEKVMLPKFEFLLSKGASSADIVHIVSKGPRFLARSLENHIIPAYEFVRGFLQSDKQTIDCINRYSTFVSDSRVTLNIKMLLENGVAHSNISRLLRAWPGILCSLDLINTVEELKELGFNPSTSNFSVALRAKITVSKTRWAEKTDIFKKWGWSEEAILEAFRKHPHCLLSSSDKINAMMSFWVNQLGLNSLDLVKAPLILQLSLQKRIIPRASVVQFLLSKGLRKKNASSMVPFIIPEKKFLEKFVKCFKEESSHLIKLYEEKMNLANNKENTCM